MEMFFLFGIGLVFFFLASLVVTWVNFAQINRLRNEIANLRNQIRRLLADLEKPRKKTVKPPQEKPAAEHIAPVITSAPLIVRSPQIIRRNQPEVKEPEPVEKKPRISFEQQFGARLPVWIGGVAMVLAGFFLVKYSIEQNLLSPSVRVIIGFIFGGALLYAATWIRNKPDFANGVRISQALSGAGIADLYFCIFAATNLYHLVPSSVGFVGMALITATAVVLSLRHGMPIALLGLIGGFVTPAMISSPNPRAWLLFIYLYFVLTGLMVVIRKNNWWILAIPSVIGAFLWVFLWIFGGHYEPSDAMWLGLFLIAVSATVVFSSKDEVTQETGGKFKTTSVVNYLSLGGALLIMAFITSWNNFGLMEWGMFGLLSLGGIGLAFFNQRIYGLVPWLSMGVNAFMLMTWHTSDTNAYALTISLFAAMYIISGYTLQSRSEKPLIWAGLTGAASIGFYLIAYYNIRNMGLVDNIPMFWGTLALIFAALGTYALQNIIRQVPEDHPRKQHLMAIYATTCTAFLSIALTIETPREFLSVAFALQMLAVSWINTWVNIKALRYIAGILGVVFAYLLIPQILLLIQITIYSLIEAKLYLVAKVPIVDWPTFQLGLPALLFLTSSYLLRMRKDDRLVRAFELASIALVAIMGYYLIRKAFHVDENILFVTANFLEAGVITNILFLYGLVCLLAGRIFTRKAVSLGGLILIGIAIFRICYFDILFHNPLWSYEAVGTYPIFNTLLLVYGLPILWTWKAIDELRQMGHEKWSKIGYGFILVLSFVLISLYVRQFFHGTYLNGVIKSNGEIYSYSVVWLLYGIGLLLLGTYRKDKLIRVASLVIMILTVGKVFLYDASELEGLFRVFSFFGLGLSLMGLSWFYTRYVFTKEDSQTKPD
jgi:uncharacterized membrane protein